MNSFDRQSKYFHVNHLGLFCFENVIFSAGYARPGGIFFAQRDFRFSFCQSWTIVNAGGRLPDNDFVVNTPLINRSSCDVSYVFDTQSGAAVQP